MSDIVIGIIAGSIVSLISFILGLFGNMWYGNYKERKKTRKESLRIHFDDIRILIINILLDMSSTLAIKNNQLVFSAFQPGRPIMEHYTFEADENYLSFEVHFPKRAEEWKRLNDKALMLKELLEKLLTQEKDIRTLEMIKKVGGYPISEDELDSNLKEKGEVYENINTELNNNLDYLQSEFNDFAIRLAGESESIDKYQIGVVFKRSNKCPICKKF